MQVYVYVCIYVYIYIYMYMYIYIYILTRRSLFGSDGIALRCALEAGGP